MVLIPALYVTKTELSHDFQMATWTSVKLDQFLEFSEKYEASRVGTLDCNLFTGLTPFFKGTKGLCCQLIYQSHMRSDEYPKIRVKETHILRKYQESQMSKGDLLQASMNAYHP